MAEYGVSPLRRAMRPHDFGRDDDSLWVARENRQQQRQKRNAGILRCAQNDEPLGLLRSEALEVGFGGVEFGEEALFGLELAGVDAAAAGFDADGVLEVEHLVVEEVLDGAAGGVGAVEDAADDDGVVGGVVVAEHAAGVVGGPG
jgi:hypothetical protein